MTAKINMLAIDLAKGSFQVCAVGPDGAVISNRALSRTRLAALLAEQPACVVAMEACATSHHWGRVADRHGHEVRLVPPAWVKPFVKRQKNDRGRGSHRAGGHAPDHALRGGEERRDPGPSSGVPDAPMPCPATHAAHQRATGTIGRVRARGAEAAGEPECVGECARPMKPPTCPARSGIWARSASSRSSGSPR